MNRIQKLMGKILEKPYLYVGNFNLHRIHLWLCGYLTACDEDGEDYSEFMRGFQNFVEQRCEDNRTLNWASMLLDKYEEHEAFEYFKKYWKEYTGLCDDDNRQ